jgi:hypothetical protein
MPELDDHPAALPGGSGPAEQITLQPRQYND